MTEFDAEFWAAVHAKASEIREEHPELAAMERQRGALDYYDRDGNPIPYCVSMALLCDPFRDPYKRVAETTVGVEPLVVWVSTVWLGMDHGIGRGRPPQIFETMAFWPEGEFGITEVIGEGDWTRRYSTEAAALEGHRTVVAEVEAAFAKFGLALAAIEEGS